MYTPKGEINDDLYEVLKNGEVLAKLSEAKSPDECYEIVTAAGVKIEKEDFKNSMEIMNAYLQENEDGVLTDEDLDEVAGGKSSSSREKVKDATDGLKLAGAAIGVIGGIVGAAAAAI